MDRGSFKRGFILNVKQIHLLTKEKDTLQYKLKEAWTK
jgi:hypothetical protein